MHWHKWGKWEQYQQTYKVVMSPGILAPRSTPTREFEEIQTRQRRTCTVCGKMQDEQVKKDA